VTTIAHPLDPHEETVRKGGPQMETSTNKATVLEALRRERVGWEALLAEVGEERMLQPGAAGEWTFKDVAAHLSAWRRRSIARLAAASRGEPTPPNEWPAGLEDDDEINAWFHEIDRDRPLPDVLRESREQFGQLEALVQAFPEQELLDPGRFPELEGQSLGAAIVSGLYFGHLHEEHDPAIRAWLATLG
jgi:Protein of unknown function (DUF1706)